MRESQFLAGAILALLVALPSARSDELPRAGNLLARSEWAKLDIVEGRIRVTDYKLGRESKLAASHPDTGMQEALAISTRNPQSIFLRYECVSPDERWTVQAMGNGIARIERKQFGESPETVRFTQPAHGACILSVDDGDRLHEWSGDSVWHLILERPEDCRQHFLPILDQLRSDWLMHARSRQVERQLLAIAESGKLPTTEELQSLVDRLRHPDFAERQAADRQLRSLGQIAVGFIDRLDKQGLDAEQRSRLEGIRWSLKVSDGDTDVRVAARLAGDAAVWIALLDREDPATRQLAARHLGVLTGKSITFDALASQQDRGQQLQRLRRELGIEQPILVGTHPGAILR